MISTAGRTDRQNVRGLNELQLNSCDRACVTVREEYFPSKTGESR